MMMRFLSANETQLVIIDTTSFSYWFNWRVELCMFMILGSFFTSIILIVRFEWFFNGERTIPEVGYNVEDGWKPLLVRIHPAWLLLLRTVAFLSLLFLIIMDTKVHGLQVFFFYSVWTFVLNTLYFGMGLFMSLYGCYHHYHRHNAVFMQTHPPNYVAYWSYYLQILFQMQVGATVFSVFIFWLEVISNKVVKDIGLIHLGINSVNLGLLLVETVFNSVKFPWFRIAYFILWTITFVVVQWILHMCSNSFWWPFDFLILAHPWAPMRYLLLLGSHVPCYGLFMYLDTRKQRMIERYNNPAQSQSQSQEISLGAIEIGSGQTSNVGDIG